jgi:lipocalin
MNGPLSPESLVNETGAWYQVVRFPVSVLDTCRRSTPFL